MRSAVSYMLSHAPGEPSMSRPDYEQCAFHHGCLLVLLRGVGPAKPRSLQKIFEKVRRVNNIKITDDGGNVRDIWVRYIHDHPVENNDWGDFQTHRRLLGLITIGKFDNQPELNELCRQHESLKVRYSATLYDSRAFFYGPARPERITTPTDGPTKGDIDGDGVEQQQQQRPMPRLEDEFTTPSNFKAQAHFYREHDACAPLESQVAELINSLFWTLEGRRRPLASGAEKLDSLSLLFAPFEKKEHPGLDKDARSSHKRLVGRGTKHLADLSLQAGLVREALNLFHKACDTLRAINDTLWTSAAEEGLCAASIMLLYPHLRDVGTVRRNASLQDVVSPLRPMPEKWRPTNATKRLTCGADVAPPCSTTTPVASNSSSSSSVSSILTNASSSSASTSSSSTSSSTSTATATATTATTTTTHAMELPRNILRPDDIPSYYCRIVLCYSKFGSAAVVLTEAALKAARLCIEQGRPVDVAMFLQRLLNVNVSMSDQERVRRFEVITDLYQQIGYRRKAAFFQRRAALKHVQAGNLTPDWAQSYRLMLDSFAGYNLTLDPLEVLDSATGWPHLQIELLQALMAAARRLGHSALATRHMTFLLQTQWQFMSAAQQSEMALQLQNLSAQCEGSPVPLVLENGTVIPPANLTDLPVCLELTVQDLPAHLRPQRLTKSKADSGPFLFTPIHFNSLDRREKKDKNKIGFHWVQNDLSEVTLRFCNPLPFELSVSDMRLLTTGIVFEALPQSVLLQPHVPTVVTLHGTPLEWGPLEVHGYSTHTLGVKSNCRLKHMRGRSFPPHYQVDVIAALPRLAIKTSLPQTATFSSLASSDLVVTSASLTLYHGESSECVVTITNDSQVPVEHLEVTINSNVDVELQKVIFQIDDADLQSKLPIPPKATIDFIVSIFGEADFVCPVLGQRAASLHSSGCATTMLNQDYTLGGGGGGAAATAVAATTTTSTITTTTMAAAPASLPYSSVSSTASPPSRVSSPNPAAMRRNEAASSSFRSSNSANTTLLSLPAACGPGSAHLSHIEAQFRIRYSGGEALLGGYCRQCAIAFSLELLPSAQITSWDVLPAEIPSQFYLVLDVANLTAQEMSLHYTDTKSILIEAKESCRVPIPVDRCSLEEVCRVREADRMENMQKELCFRTPLLSLDDSISRLCSQHIADRVNISWLLTGTDIAGIARLHGIVLSPAMIDLTTVSPLQWTVFFQNTPVQQQSEVMCVAGERATLSVNVCNQSQRALRNLVLTVRFYQDYLNGIENYNLEKRVAISGPSKTTIPVLLTHESIGHECSVVFFTPGRFKTSIQCHSRPTQTMANTTTTTTIATAAGQPILNDVAAAATTTGFNEQQEHIWKFIPPIEVTVIEQH